MAFRRVLRPRVLCSAAAASTGVVLQDGQLQQRRAPLRSEAPAESWSQQWNWYDDSAGGPQLRAPRWPGARPKLGEPAYSSNEVAAHDGTGADGTIWVTYRDGVYDMTRYIKMHPGGPIMRQSAGGPIEGFWDHWHQHHISPKVKEALDRYRIGRLSDYKPPPDEARHGGGIWEDEQKLPSRIANRAMAPRYCEMPYVSETPAALLLGSHFTPNAAFYVRNHAPVPTVPADEADEHVITFCAGEKEVSLSLGELRSKFAGAQVVSVMQCSGNRGADNIAANGVQNSGFVGGPFEHIGLGLLGNAQWSGVRLADVLRELLPGETDMAQQPLGPPLHVTFEGLDGYSTSTPLPYIMDPANQCLLAIEMNHEPLPPDHGFPVRALLPGVTGARHVKWVSKIVVGGVCQSPWNQYFYKDKPSGNHLQKLPMNSVILSPEPGGRIPAEATTILVQGVAYSGGNSSGIAAVEVSADRGKTWSPCRCRFDEAAGAAGGSSPGRGWVRFEAAVTLPDAPPMWRCATPLPELWCRARCRDGEEQPERSGAHGGYFFNGYHKVPLVRVAQENAGR